MDIQKFMIKLNTFVACQIPLSRCMEREIYKTCQHNCFKTDKKNEYEYAEDFIKNTKFVRRGK